MDCAFAGYRARQPGWTSGQGGDRLDPTPTKSAPLRTHGCLWSSLTFKPSPGPNVPSVPSPPLFIHAHALWSRCTQPGRCWAPERTDTQGGPAHLKELTAVPSGSPSPRAGMALALPTSPGTGNSHQLLKGSRCPSPGVAPPRTVLPPPSRGVGPSYEAGACSLLAVSSSANPPHMPQPQRPTSPRASRNTFTVPIASDVNWIISCLKGKTFQGLPCPQIKI